MAIPTAYAITEINDVLLIACPHCSKIHQVLATTGRLVPIVSQCDNSLQYVITATMKEKSFVTAIKGYYYDVERKKNRKSKQKEGDE